MLVDLRSDTVTQPSPAMREAMQNAPLGDDVFGEDPTVNRLESLAAQTFGMEAAVFCPSGTMTNQIAIKCHTQPGDEVICDENSHVYQYEGGGIAFNSGCSVKLLAGDRGRITADQVESAIQPDDPHRPVSRLVVVENTSNRGGGSCYAFEELTKIGAFCKKKGLSYHIDGARLFNAMVVKKESPLHYGAIFDSISICLSKGLGAPVGSLLLGQNSFIKKARRIRKVFGGGMRQAGSLAAAGIYALENNIDRLKMDHERAKAIEEVLLAKSFVKGVLPVETNIVIATCNTDADAKNFIASMKEKGILFFSIAPGKFRMVTHLDLTDQKMNYLLDSLKKF